MLRGMPPVVQHQSPELPASDGSAHALPRPLKLPVIVRRNNLCEEGPLPLHYITGTPVIPHKTGMLWCYRY